MKSEITNKNTIAKPLDRKSPRARWHDYSGGEYFVTVCTKNRQHYFGEVSSGNNVVLTPIGSYLKMQIENLPQHYPYASVFTYIIMPNHIHLIIKIDANKTPYDRRDVARRDVARRRAVARRGPTRPHHETRIFSSMIFFHFFTRIY